MSDLNCAVEDEDTNCWGREFHIGIIRYQRNYKFYNFCTMVFGNEK